ncbi:cytochrome c biogenesis heme-transporting ATPase CcmA [Cupriavidus necator]|uniref:ABC-type transporter, ATPase component: HemeE family n=1 Tax=Cupriavidus necator (strain ATCC 17699 / DSM 428 / KCTC 22496 / NCIMB 10442 / H16 / Stanier 337) TaxID=381666 RepID=Q0K2N1_CUPNH|nr:cytochrome c biogenesis heme-transporting ATPase CcmA [Cupriavidus necator]QCC03635.1 cytochrome c biogenesis heme-transporting ATPase CcmA [Cupriavidus necator H16]QQB80689.1 cytochrome c biogenesis heme-transporting ATPase CcmA [Cupriavidus necator]WKA44979.1 cytochrome c biogenesis heme-transporting ATPase CcmA [Cupriavidus necator]CAJ95743.1 ABC-type transporter, ATPase component: HemeE family [Cupriavidus necator H16]
MLEAVSLTAARGDRPIFIRLGLRVEPGQAVHVTGANGSGKTTLLRILAGLLRPESGEIRWNGCAVAASRPLPDSAYLGHRNGLKAELSALENLRSACALYGCRTDRAHLQRVLAQVGLAAGADTALGLLSQGQQRRVALARVLSSGAKLWLLDEPTTALDQSSIRAFEGLCEHHLQSGGMLVFANHYPLRLVAARMRELAIPAIADRSQQEAACWIRS